MGLRRCLHRNWPLLGKTGLIVPLSTYIMNPRRHTRVLTPSANGASADRRVVRYFHLYAAFWKTRGRHARLPRVFEFACRKSRVLVFCRGLEQLRCGSFVFWGNWMCSVRVEYVVIDLVQRPSSSG